MKTFGELVRYYRELRGWSQEQLARKSGLNRGRIAAIEHRKQKKAPADAVVALAEALFISPRDLMPSFIEHLDNYSQTEETAAELFKKVRSRMPIEVDIYRLHAGTRPERVGRMYINRLEFSIKNALGYKVEGTCLEPEIKDGDTIIVDLDAPVELGDIVVCETDEDMHIGRIGEKEGKRWIENSEDSFRVTETCKLTKVILATSGWREINSR